MPINESHPAITVPTSNISIWRYMDIPSFLSLLLDESLTFVRADLFEDKFEGKLPEKTAQITDLWAREQIQAGKLKRGYWNLSEILNKERKDIYINCWCNEQHEMVNMWKIYSKENGIAIETDYEILKKSILSKESICPTIVKYVDFKNDYIDEHSNGLTVFTIKRKEYKSENEFRLIMSYPRIVENEVMKYEPDKMEAMRDILYRQTPVIKCKIDIHKMIKKIHISPYAPKWYLNLVIDLTEKFNLHIEEISQSEL